MSAEPIFEPTPHIRIGEMTLEHWEKLKTIDPWKSLGNLPDPTNSRIVVAFDDEGNLKGYWAIFQAIHIEPLWLHESCRGNPRIARGMWKVVRDILHELKVKLCFGFVQEHQLRTMGLNVEKFGGQHIPGQLYIITVDPETVPHARMAMEK